MSTTENLAVIIWKNMEAELKRWKASEASDQSELMTHDAQLFEIKIHETDKNVVVYRGE